MLTEPQWLLERLPDLNIIIADARPQAMYEAGHIPGAVNLNVYDYMITDSTPEGLTGTTEEIRSLLLPLGLQDQHVIWLDEATGMRETRGLWFLLYLGYKNTSVLHGGMNAWRALGGPVTRASTQRPPALPATQPDPSVLATLPQVAEAALGGGLRLVDVRSADEYRGTGGYPCCDRQGHVPGATLLEWSRFVGPDGRFRPLPELQALVQAAGLDPAQETVVYCHRGARSANTFLALRSLGFEKVRNFPGSWHEYAAQFDLPSEP